MIAFGFTRVTNREEDRHSSGLVGEARTLKSEKKRRSEILVKIANFLKNSTLLISKEHNKKTILSYLLVTVWWLKPESVKRKTQEISDAI